MKKILKIASIVLLAAIAFVPIPSSGNGGTKMYSALTYKFVVWDEKADDCYLDSTEFYLIPKNFWSTDALRDDMIKSGSAIMPYDSEWIEKVDSSKAKGLDFSEITIREIYADCFIASSHRAPPNTYKINCEYTGELCVGDYVSCVCDNTYVHNDRCEGDLVSIKVLEPLPKSDSFVAYKPVIYLYPEETTYVTVRLALDGEFTCTYPACSDGWRVTASPDGTLTDDGGMTYNYLYWEGETNAEFDFSSGFCVRGCDTAEFLEKALCDAGLTRREANEFIVYWLPLMQDNEYNVISFQGASYTDAAPLDVTPSPDTTLRVFMAWYSSDTAVEIEPQTLTSPERGGFTVVEWGGTEVK